MRLKIAFWTLVVAGAVASGYYGYFQYRQARKVARLATIPHASYERPRELGRHTDVVVNATKQVLKIPIITYHYVEHVADPGDKIRRSLNINPEVLDGELTALEQAGYHTYYVRDIPRLVDGELTYSTRSAVLTFDDGYEDFYTDVFPKLKKHHMVATIFVINNYVNRRGFMTDSQLKTIVDSGLVEIGAHTLNHAYLKGMNLAKVRTEVMESKSRLEKLLGAHVTSFAYPYGALSAEAVQSVREASYSAAVSEISGSVQSDENLMYLSRIRAGHFSAATIVPLLESLHS